MPLTPEASKVSVWLQVVPVGLVMVEIMVVGSSPQRQNKDLHGSFSSARRQRRWGREGGISPASPATLKSS